MAKCDYCGSTILFGGKRQATFVFAMRLALNGALFWPFHGKYRRTSSVKLWNGSMRDSVRNAMAQGQLMSMCTTGSSRLSSLLPGEARPRFPVGLAASRAKWATPSCASCWVGGASLGISDHARSDRPQRSWNVPWTRPTQAFAAFRKGDPDQRRCAVSGPAAGAESHASGGEIRARWANCRLLFVLSECRDCQVYEVQHVTFSVKKESIKSRRQT